MRPIPTAAILTSPWPGTKGAGQSAGTLDTTFGRGAGYVLTPFANGNAEASGLVVDGSGNIVVAGYAPDPASGVQDVAVARYLGHGSTAGALDTTFGGSGTGYATTVLGDAGYAGASGVTLDGKGDILVAGYVADSGNGYNTEFVVARYFGEGTAAPGTPDTAFGGTGTGTVFTPFANGNAQPNGISVESDGNIAVAGQAPDPAASGTTDFAVAVYVPSGALNTGFGAGGIAVTRVGAGDSQANAVAFDGNGNIVTAGFAEDGGGNTDFAGGAVPGIAAGVSAHGKDGRGNADQRHGGNAQRHGQLQRRGDHGEL